MYFAEAEGGGRPNVTGLRAVGQPVDGAGCCEQYATAIALAESACEGQGRPHAVPACHARANVAYLAGALWRMVFRQRGSARLGGTGKAFA